MIASLHLADLDPRAALKFLTAPMRAASTPGPRYAAAMLTAPLSPRLLKRMSLRRVGLLTFFDTEEALDAFLAEDPRTAPGAPGWHARLVPVRAVGDWPGLTDQPVAGHTDGVAVTVTLGRLRVSQTVRFLRTSAPAEAQALQAPGFVWGTALARPPMVATCSIWQDAAALARYAHSPEADHAAAITDHEKRPFHHRSAFLRLRPSQVTGHLAGPNPLPEGCVPGA